MIWLNWNTSISTFPNISSLHFQTAPNYNEATNWTQSFPIPQEYPENFSHGKRNLANQLLLLKCSWFTHTVRRVSENLFIESSVSVLLWSYPWSLECSMSWGDSFNCCWHSPSKSQNLSCISRDLKHLSRSKIENRLSDAWQGILVGSCSSLWMPPWYRQQVLKLYPYFCVLYHPHVAFFQG